jgi:hypothetical protein
MVPYSERRFQIGFAHRGRPYSADNDIVGADRVNDFPATINELSPTPFAQFAENCSSFGMLKKNLRAIINAQSNPCRSFRIPTRDVANDRLDVAGGFFRPN